MERRGAIDPLMGAAIAPGRDQGTARYPQVPNLVNFDEFGLIGARHSMGMSDTGIRVGAALLVTVLAGVIGLRSTAPAHQAARRPPTVPAAARPQPQPVTTAGAPMPATTSTTTVSDVSTDTAMVLGWSQPPRHTEERHFP